MSDRRSRRAGLPLLPLAGVVAAGAVLRIAGLRFGLPNIYARPDESDLVQISLSILRGDLNPHFFNYPTLFMYVNSALYAGYCGWRVAAGRSPSIAGCADGWPYADQTFLLIGRAVSAMAGVISIVLVYSLGRRLGRNERERMFTGLGSALLIAVALLHVRDSHFGVTDVPMTAGVLLSIDLLLRAHERPALRRFAAAGAAAGLAAAVKYNAVLLGAAFAAGQLAAAVRWPAPRLKRIVSNALAYGGSAAAAFAIATPYALIDRARFARDVAFEAAHMQAGHMGNADRIGWLHHATTTLPDGVGWVLFLAGVGGVIYALVGRRGVEAAVIFAFPLVYYVVSGRAHTVFARYMIPVVPFLCLGAGQLAAAVASEARRTIVAVLLVLAAAAPTLAKSLQLDRILARPDSRVLAADYVRQLVPAGASIFASGVLYAQPDVTSNGRLVYENWGWNRFTNRFTSPHGERADWPDWLLLQTSPLALYTPIPDRIRQGLDRYVLSREIDGAGGAPDSFDQQDAWFLPMSSLGSVARPGPTVSIYRLREGQ